MSASDTTEEKASLLELQASLRASVLCGLVEAQGSAKFVHDKQQFENQSRVTLQYKATTHFEQLSLSTADWDNMKDTGLGTHVVTGIEYGAHAFFVFDSHILQASEVHEFKLQVQIIINLLFFSIHFDYERDLTEEQKSVVKKLKVKFYSDFVLEHSPASLTEAVQTYRHMSKLLGEHGENSVPVRVWLMPLKH
ncbi:hypothetical protein WMY93_001939 [Mugilogobius chulae]|uniref:Uncharacterized protein n=1 Tax=Mugilogobius chulae TaxID=88201 RepID=A0AAW0PS53_9GOBI